MRIIAGSAKRRNIVAPKGDTTRPTQDYIRESLFNILQNYVYDANILDIFAGSGALGLEAISRGARHCLFCDKNYRAIQAIQENITNLHFDEQSTLIKGDFTQALQYAEEHNLAFDIFFIDPPYAFAGIDNLLNACIPLSAEDALFIVERDKSSPAPICNQLEIYDTRNYGITNIYLLRKKGV